MKCNEIAVKWVLRTILLDYTDFIITPDITPLQTQTTAKSIKQKRQLEL